MTMSHNNTINAQITEVCTPLLDINFSLDSTKVDNKDIPELSLVYVNAPEELDSAVQRILKAEMVLEDLVRAVEIAQATQQWQLMDSFISEATAYLSGKIQIEQPDFGPLKLQVVTGTLENSDAEAGRS